MSNFTSTKVNSGNYDIQDPLALCATSGWVGSIQGTNTSGFNSMPTGYYEVSTNGIGYPTNFSEANYVTADYIPATVNQFSQYGFAVSLYEATIFSAPNPNYASYSVRFVKGD